MDTTIYPLVYIIVVTWDGKNDTLECLRSLQKISYPRSKVVVVDNASVDGTVEAVRMEFPGVEILRNETNLRYAGGNNRGISFALDQGAGVVLLLNNDTIVDPGFLSVLVQTLMSDAKNGIIGPKILYYSDPQRIWYAGGKIDWWQGWVSHIGIREVDHAQHDTITTTGYVTGCCMLVKRDVIERCGMLDESYFLYGEDVDWCLRASREGYRIIFQPQARVWHKVSASSGHLSLFKNINKLKSQLRFLARYARWYHWMTIPLGICWNLLKSIISVV
ncbi:MAG: glycosyltransferase family 2 protein [Bacteroidota bacterium]